MAHGRVQECPEDDCDGVSYCSMGTIITCHKCGSSHDYGSRREVQSNARYIENNWTRLSDFFDEMVDSEISFARFQEDFPELFSRG